MIRPERLAGSNIYEMGSRYLPNPYRTVCLHGAFNFKKKLEIYIIYFYLFCASGDQAGKLLSKIMILLRIYIV